MGVLQWSPEQFWTSTMHDLMSADAGFRDYMNPKKAQDEPMTMAEFKEMDHLYKTKQRDEMKRKFG